MDYIERLLQEQVSSDILNYICDREQLVEAILLLACGVKPDEDTLNCAYMSYDIDLLQLMICVGAQWNDYTSYCAGNSGNSEVLLLIAAIKPSNYTFDYIDYYRSINVTLLLVLFGAKAGGSVLNSVCRLSDMIQLMICIGTEPNKHTLLIVCDCGTINDVQTIVAMNTAFDSCTLKYACYSNSIDKVISVLSIGAKHVESPWKSVLDVHIRLLLNELERI